MPSCSEPPVPSRPTSFQSRGQPAGFVEAACLTGRRAERAHPAASMGRCAKRALAAWSGWRGIISTPLTGRCRVRRARSLRHGCCVPLGSGSGERRSIPTYTAGLRNWAPKFP